MNSLQSSVMNHQTNAYLQNTNNKKARNILPSAEPHHRPHPPHRHPVMEVMEMLDDSTNDEMIQ